MSFHWGRKKIKSVFFNVWKESLGASWIPCTSRHLFCLCPHSYHHHLWVWITGKTRSCPSPVKQETVCLKLALSLGPAVLLRSTPCWLFPPSLPSPSTSPAALQAFQAFASCCLWKSPFGFPLCVPPPPLVRAFPLFVWLSSIAQSSGIPVKLTFNFFLS